MDEHIEADSIRNPDNPELVVQPYLQNTVTTNVAVEYSNSKNNTHSPEKDVVQQDSSQKISEINANNNLQHQHQLPVTGYSRTMDLTVVGFALFLNCVVVFMLFKK